MSIAKLLPSSSSPIEGFKRVEADRGERTEYSCEAFIQVIRKMRRGAASLDSMSRDADDEQGRCKDSVDVVVENVSVVSLRLRIDIKLQAVF